jgi:hypothetical protein
MTASQMPNWWISGQIGCRHHRLGRRSRNGKCVTPAQERVAGHFRRSPGLADKHMIEFANHLDRNDISLLWNVTQQFEHDIALFSAIDPFRTGKNIGVEGDLHWLSS